ncbi:hypothetical protein [Glycomyces paridis]|uniref:Uncharacterized protein n=1 Tax=Glycomyces paridis TaxID=2126555 RepID=A0A4S8PL65_9ACTN|nr:hypothetical protein [Glycomyces paridis]THV31480.1 hypothetical protein E9998_03710 [Glycomyces paridis]
MSAMARVKGGLKSAAGSTWAVTKKLLVRIAIAAAIMVVAVALAKHGESSASEGSGASGTDAHPIAAQRAILTEGWTAEQSLSCAYTVNATFGVSIFTQPDMGARRLVRLHDDTVVHGACETIEGGRTIGCAGLRWETTWIRIQSGDTVGFSPASCLVEQGVL